MKKLYSEHISDQEKWCEDLAFCLNPLNLKDIYDKDTAEAVASYLKDFLPYATNYPARLFFLKRSTKSAISISFLLRIIPKGKNSVNEVDAGFMIPRGFPVIPIRCRLRFRGIPIPNINKEFLNGTEVDLNELSALKKLKPPYPLIDILVALCNWIEEEFQQKGPCLQEKKEEKQQETRNINKINYNSNNVHNLKQNGMKDTSTTTNTPNELNRKVSKILSPVEKQRLRLQQQAAGCILEWQENSVQSYLQLREESIPILNNLCNSTEKSVNSICELQDQIENLTKLITRFDTLLNSANISEEVEDSLEEHSKCIIPVDDIQARALELLGEIHASDDCLELLEKSLKLGQLSCEEYIRRVSDISRTQFEARFLFGRLTEFVNSKGMYDPSKELRKEFPQVGTKMINAVLNLVAGDIKEARVRLLAMVSNT